jgi:protease YdgD
VICVAVPAAAAILAASAAAMPLTKPDAPRRAVEPVAVFGGDDRQPVPAKYEAVAQALGILFNNQTRTVCSAFCVGPNIVATAAHCMAGPSTGRSAARTDFMFARNYGRSRELVRVEGAATRSSAQNVLTGDFRLRVRPPIDAAHDWALVRLSKPVCAKRELTVRALSADALIEEARAGRIFQVSYHRDYVQWKAAYSKPCKVERDFENAEWTTIAPDFLEPGRMVMHTCDTGGASSGSPLLVDTPDGPVAVAINVGTYVQSKVVMQNGQMTHRQRAETVANTAVNAEAFADKIDLLRSALILASGAPIRDLQAHLRQYKLYTGRLDGTYGPALRAAIESYERAHTLPVTGLATRGLLLRLASERAQAPTGALPKSGK